MTRCEEVSSYTKRQVVIQRVIQRGKDLYKDLYKEVKLPRLQSLKV